MSGLLTKYCVASDTKSVATLNRPLQRKCNAFFRRRCMAVAQMLQIYFGRKCSISLLICKKLESLQIVANRCIDQCPPLCCKRCIPLEGMHACNADRIKHWRNRLFPLGAWHPNNALRHSHVPAHGPFRILRTYAPAPSIRAHNWLGFVPWGLGFPNIQSLRLSAIGPIGRSHAWRQSRAIFSNIVFQSKNGGF